MEKILFACDELTGLIGAAARMRPSKSVMDMELSSLKKKYKDKRFAAGCSPLHSAARGKARNQYRGAVLRCPSTPHPLRFRSPRQNSDMTYGRQHKRYDKYLDTHVINAYERCVIDLDDDNPQENLR